MKKILINLLYVCYIDFIFEKLVNLIYQSKVRRLESKLNLKINFISQGYGGIDIIGDISKFYIDNTSHLKSNTVIESSGGVKIGKYFHCGRGLTIFSTNHNYNSKNFIPYDKESIIKPVCIKDFVWCGSNVTIIPGVTVGEGVVIGSGSVVTRDIPDFAIIGGNPAKIIKYRDTESFLKLKIEKKFF